MAEKKEKINLFKPVNDILSGNFFGKQFMMKNMSYVAYVGFLVLLYIWYGYYADGVMKQASALEDMEELNSELHATIKELNQVSLQSNIVNYTKELGLEELQEAPVKIEKKEKN